MQTLNQVVFGIYPYVVAAAFLVGCLIRFDRAQYSWRSGSSQLLRRRMLPIVGRGGGHYGFLDVEDAATATIAALTGPPGTYNIVDDDPAPSREWIPSAASALRARPPRHVPRALLAAGPLASLRYLLDEHPPVSNTKARDRLGWAPSHNWRTGLLQSLTGQ